jgi:hypothetical protein
MTTLTIFDPALRPQLVAYTKSIMQLLDNELGLDYDAMLACLLKKRAFCDKTEAIAGEPSQVCQGKKKDGTGCTRNATCGAYCKTHQPKQSATKTEDIDLETIEIQECKYWYHYPTKRVFSYADTPNHIGDYEDGRLHLVALST